MNQANEWTRKNVFTVLVTCLFLISWLIFIANPFDIIASNIDEYTTVAGKDILFFGLRYVGLSMIVVVVASLLILTLPRIIQKFIVILTATVAVTTWVVSTILVGNYGEFDGRNNLVIDAWSWNSILQWVVFVGILLIFIVQRNKPKMFYYVTISLMVTSMFTAGFNIYDKSIDDSNNIVFQTENPQAEKDFFTYSKNNKNVILIVWDEYQTQFFESILDEKVKEQLKGFTWFRDNAANFPTTLAAMPTIFTGEVYDNEQTLKSFIQKNDHKSIPSILVKSGVKVNWYGFGGGIFAKDGFVRLLSDTNLKSKELLNYSLFRTAPDIAKSLIYNNENWLITTDELISPEARLFNYVAEHQLHIKENYPDTFKYFHSKLTHSPVNTDVECNFVESQPTTFRNKSDEGRCAVSILKKLIENLEKNNVFDNTMIIVVADHGNQMNLTVNNGFNHLPFGSASSTLLIKPFNAKEDFRINIFPSQLQDLYSTILNAYGVAALNKNSINLLYNMGETPLDLPNKRVRYFNNYFWSKEFWDWDQASLPNITTYKIEGALHEFKEWSIDRVQLNVVQCNQKLLLSENETKNNIGTYGLSGTESIGRWVDGIRADLYFRPADSCEPDTLDVKTIAFLPEQNSVQNALVYINDMFVGSISASIANSTQQVSFKIPDKVDKKNIKLTLKIDKPLKPIDFNPKSKDERHLSFALESISLKGVK